MPPVISIVGYSGSGKTTLIEKLVPVLKQRGYRIGTIKHASKGFSLDKKGKDSWRHKAAGADAVMVVSPDGIAFVKNENCDNLTRIEPYFDDMDLVITEGYKKEHHPKILVFQDSNPQILLTEHDSDLIALVTDADIDVHVPKFGLNHIDALADLIESRFLLKK